MTKSISESLQEGVSGWEAFVRVLDIEWKALEERLAAAQHELRPFYIRGQLTELLREFLADDEVDIAELVERIIDITGGVKCKT